MKFLITTTPCGWLFLKKRKDDSVNDRTTNEVPSNVIHYSRSLRWWYLAAFQFAVLDEAEGQRRWRQGKKKKPISTFRSVQMYNYSHGCTHIPPQQCTRLCIWGQKELNLRPFSVGTTFVVLHLIFFLPLLCDCVAAGCARVSSTCLQTFTSSISKRLLFFFFRPHSVRTCWFTLRPSLFQVGTLSSTRPCWLSSSV